MTDMERFMANVIPEPNSGCWLWVGATNKTGYGSFHPQKSNPTNAHRWLFKETTGMDLNGLNVCHKCDLPVCVNPQHMFPGTQKENMQDAARKGRKKHQPWRKRNQIRTALAATPAEHARRIKAEGLRDIAAKWKARGSADAKIAAGKLTEEADRLEAANATH